MPISLTGLVTGGNRLLAARGRGQVEGEDKRLEREQQAAAIQRQALRDSLLDRYQTSQIDYMNAGAEQRRQPKAPKADSYQFLTGPSGEVLAGNRGTGVVRPAGQSVGARPVPAGRRTGTGGTATAPAATLSTRMAQQSADAFAHAVDDMTAFERANPDNANDPDIAAAIEGVGNVPVVGGLVRGVTAPAAQRQRSPGQQQYRNALNLAVDHYIGTLKLRASIPVLENLRRNLAPQAGQNSPEVRRNLARTRAYLKWLTRRTAYGVEAAGPEPDRPAGVSDELVGAIQESVSGNTTSGGESNAATTTATEPTAAELLARLRRRP